MPGGMEQQSSLTWFVKHPILSSVVWIFGRSKSTPSTSYDVDELSSMNTSRQRLSWSDEHGKSLVEVLGTEVRGRPRAQRVPLFMPPPLPPPPRGSPACRR